MPARILTAEFAHESNTFSRMPTDEQAFRDGHYLIGADAVDERGARNTSLAGFLDAGNQHGWRVEHVLSAGAGPSGRVTDAAFDRVAGQIVDAAGDGCDAILLGLHGAMVTDSHEDGEGELLRRLRAVTGGAIPIGITLDPHANVSQAMCELADIVLSYKTYPHTDMRDIARQAGEILQRCLRGEIRPATIRVGCPMLEETNGGRTDIGPMLERLDAALQWERRDDVYAVSINGGFASADIADTGPTVLVTGEGDLDAHRAFATRIVEDIWRRRHEVLNDYLQVDAAARIAANFNADKGPLVIADYADNPGAGAYGDATELLRALLDAGVGGACFGPMVDAETVRQLQHHRPGDRVDVQLGGKIDPVFGGGPLALQVELVGLHDGRYVGSGAMIGGLPRSFGPTAVVRCGGIDILVTTLAQQLLDLEQFRASGSSRSNRCSTSAPSSNRSRNASSSATAAPCARRNTAISSTAAYPAPFSRSTPNSTIPTCLCLQG